MKAHGVDTAIVLAGGLGTRLRTAVPDLPKPMAPVAGRPFLEHLLDYWIAEGIGRFVLSVGYKAETIVTHFGEQYGGARIDYALETTPLGTGGGLLLAARQLADDASPFLVVNGDTFFAVRLEELAQAHRAQAADWTFALFKTSEQGRYLGLAQNADGTISSLLPVEGQTERLANGGVYLVSPSALARFAPHQKNAQPASLEGDLFPALLANGGRLGGLACTGTFIDIGIPEDYRRAATILT